MKNWRIGVFVLASAGVLIAAGASGRAATWATPEGDGEVQALDSSAVTVNGQTTADAENVSRADSSALQRSR